MDIETLINLSGQAQPILNVFATGVFTALGGGGIKVLLDHAKDRRDQRLERDKFEVKNKDDLITELSAMVQSERKRFEDEMKREREVCSQNIGILQGQITTLQNQVSELLSAHGKTL